MKYLINAVYAFTVLLRYYEWATHWVKFLLVFDQSSHICHQFLNVVANTVCRDRDVNKAE